MNTNRLVVRDLVGVALAVAAITTIGLALAPHDTDAPRHPAPVATAPASAGQPAQLGARLYEQKGCVACHSIDGSPRVGPSFLHDFGTRVPLTDGSTVAMNDDYIRESILDPRAKARPGFPPSMPSFDGILKPREIDALTAYIRSLR